MSVFTPFTNFVVLHLEPEAHSPGLIQVQRETESRVRYGRIMSIGPEVRDKKPGQRVLASLTAGVEIKPGYVVIPEQAVLAYAD